MERIYMEGISSVSTNLLANYKQPAPAEKTAEKNCSDVTVAPDIVKKETADAYKAYALINPAKKQIPENKTFDEYKTELQKEGKTEGKDFTMFQLEHTSELKLLENGKPVKILMFSNEGDSKGKLTHYREIHYPLNESGGLQSVETTYGADGQFRFRTSCYEPDKSPYKNELVNAETKANDFRKYLNENKLKYAADIDVNGDILTQSFTVFDQKNNQVLRYNFDENLEGKPLYVSKSVLGDDGNVKSMIHFTDSFTSYTEYEDSLKQ